MGHFLVLILLVTSPGAYGLLIWCWSERSSWPARRVDLALTGSWLLLPSPIIWFILNDLPATIWKIENLFVDIIGLLTVGALAYAGMFVPFILVDRRRRQTGWSLLEGVRFFLRGTTLGYVPVLVWMIAFILVVSATEWFTTRSDLEGLINRSGLPVKTIAVVPGAKSKVANAWVTGTLPFNRAILITEYLLAEFQASELLAIVAHELGHIRHRHLLRNGVMAALSMLLSGVIYRAIARILPITPLVIFIAGSVLGLVLLLLFSPISRRSEYEAEAYAVRLTGDADAVIAALRRLDGDEFKQGQEGIPSWTRYLRTHPTVADRILSIQGERSC